MDFWYELLAVFKIFLGNSTELLMSIFMGWGMSETVARNLIYFLGILLLIALMKWIEFLIVRRTRDHLPPEWEHDIGAGS